MRRVSVFADVIEVEPIIRIQATIVFHAADVALDPRAKGRRAMGAIQINAVGERLEMNVILTASLVEAKKEHDGDLQKRGQQKRPFGKHPRLAEEIAGHPFFVAEHAVPKNPDHFSAVQSFFHREHGVCCAGRDDAFTNLRTEAVKHGVQVGGCGFMHDHGDRELLIEEAVPTKDFKAPDGSPGTGSFIVWNAAVR